MFSKEVSSPIFCVFGMTRPRSEPRSFGLFTNTKRINYNIRYDNPIGDKDYSTKMKMMEMITNTKIKTEYKKLKHQNKERKTKEKKDI